MKVEIFVFLMALILHVHCEQDNDENELRVERRGRDILKLQFDGCVLHSIELPQYECVCDADHSTVMSKNNETYGCFSVNDMGCNYKLNKSEQAFTIDTDGPWISVDGISITPEVNTDSIEEIKIWNSDDKKHGDWFDITREGSSVFSIKDGNLTILNSSTNWWKGHVVWIRFGHIESECVMVKFTQQIVYPMNITNWRNHFPLLTTTTTTTAAISKAKTTAPSISSTIPPSTTTAGTTTTTAATMITATTTATTTTPSTTTITTTTTPSKTTTITTSKIATTTRATTLPISTKTKATTITTTTITTTSTTSTIPPKRRDYIFYIVGIVLLILLITLVIYCTLSDCMGRGCLFRRRRNKIFVV